VQTTRMAQLVSAADLGVGAGGLACWERCCLGLPALTLCVAENQRVQVESASRAGLTVAPASPYDRATIARHLQVLVDSPARREAMSARGMDTVDGRGVERIVGALGGGVVPACGGAP